MLERVKLVLRAHSYERFETREIEGIFGVCIDGKGWSPSVPVPLLSSNMNILALESWSALLSAVRWPRYPTDVAVVGLGHRLEVDLTFLESLPLIGIREVSYT